MKNTKDKGITLIALVITIIVLLILGGISIVAIVGDDGIIARAKESIMLTKLAGILFDMESDLFNLKTEKYGQKLNSTTIVDTIAMGENKKYTLYTTSSKTTGAALLYLEPTHNPIPTLQISIPGDVYVDNYKRGEIQISDVYEETVAEHCMYGDSKIKVNDGSVRRLSPMAYEASSMTDYFYMLWVNSHGEIVSWSNSFGFFPLGMQDYNFATYDIGWLDEFDKKYNRKYAIFPTAQCALQGDDLIVELQLFNFPETYNFLSTIVMTNDGNLKIKTITVGGTYIVKAGILVSDKPDVRSGNYFSIPGEAAAIIYEAADGSYYNRLYHFKCNNIIETLKEDGIKASRIYYRPYIYFQKYVINNKELDLEDIEELEDAEDLEELEELEELEDLEELEESDEDELPYTKEIFEYSSGTIKYIDLK